MKFKVFCVFLILVLFSNSQATTYYVKIGGNDTNTGTSWATAWATINKVNSTLVGGDTVFFGTGKFRGQIDPISGTANDRTCYACSSFVRGIAHIWGSDSVYTWIQHSGNVYKARWTPSGCYDGGDGDGAYVCGQIDATHDTFLIPVTSIPSSEGRFYYDTAKDTIYVWCYGGGSPSGKDIEPSCKTVIHFSDGEDYCTFWGFDIRYGKQGVVWLGSCSYVYFEHCKILGAGHVPWENVSCVFSSHVDIPGDHNVVRACTLGFAMDVTGLGMATCIYDQNYFVTESCVVIGGVAKGIYYKATTDNSVIRFNKVTNCDYSGIELLYGCNNDSIYGNVVIGKGANGTERGIVDNGEGNGGGSVIYNNTIYNTKNNGLHTGVGGPHISTCSFKYNIVDSIYDILGEEAGLVNCNGNDETMWVMDSNFYYNPDSVLFNNSTGGKTRTQWQVLGFEIYSTFYTNPGFTNTATEDFSRSSSTQEMNLIYGGKAWTRYGAWQPSEAPAPTDKNRAMIRR